MPTPTKPAGVYYAYTYDNPARTPAPEGYEPFYISHYGRHGSRYHSKEEAYAEPLAALVRLYNGWAGGCADRIADLDGRAMLRFARTGRVGGDDE